MLGPHGVIFYFILFIYLFIFWGGVGWGGGGIPLSLERPWRKISLLKSPASMIIWFGEEVKMEVMCV